jgi:hypothetical protein
MISRTSVLLLALLSGGASARPAATSVDALLAEKWEEMSLRPAPLCDDAEFLRRASLDLIGRVPKVDELKKFIAKPDRATKIEELLASPEFPRFWSEVWTAMLNGYASVFDSQRDALRFWLEKKFQENAPFDRIASELVSASGLSSTEASVNFILHNSVEPEIKVSRTFLGIRLDCARCHDHPFDRWTQKDYEDMARFFTLLQKENVAAGSTRVRDNPDLAKGPKPRFLTGAQPVTSRWREDLAYFITTSKPFARAFANRIWYHFMGRGIVDPPDDFSLKNRPSVPKLLEHLADEAAARKFDVRAMIRLVCSSDAYRRSSRRAPRAPRTESVFACRVLKPLTAEQLFDSLTAALDARELQARRGMFLRTFVGRSLGEDFSNVWRYRETVQDVMTKLTLDPKAPEGSLDELYLRLLSRAPSPRERELCRGRSAADVVFALANSNEFYFNH